MIVTEKQEIMNLAQKFCSDNVNNRLTEWLIESLLNRLWQKLEAICPTPQAQAPQAQPGDNPEINKEVTQ